jgi:FAD/FMN-containing dehydrogenase/Fe-S oxidoreductase
MKKDFRFREIPYNYTSFSDREIVLKYFDREVYGNIERLRDRRVTGRSAKLIFETIGDMFIIDRNPYVLEDFLENSRKLRQLRILHKRRLDTVEASARGNQVVLELVNRCRRANKQFFDELDGTKALRTRTVLGLFGATARKNIHFTPFHRVVHATDATDWRVEYPCAVVYPDSIDEVPRLVSGAQRLGLSVIPRGGGTGLTGGAIPVNKRTMMINTEKLDRIYGIRIVREKDMEIPLVGVEAGAVTDNVIEYCQQQGYIFATDPTSGWASTIGGNIAENAGGKKCVIWGTAIDNLYSFRIVDARADILEVKRRDHPYRKILPADTVIFDVYKINGKKEDPVKTVVLKGTEIRKKGLGKDITNKVLNGLPGLQKEGGDGVVISADFVLYRPFAFAKTLCLEFFGTNMVNASRAIIEIVNTFGSGGEAFLTALEHFDEKYVLAINYRNKSRRTDVPKAVLLVDIEGNAQEAVEAAAYTVADIVGKYNCEATIAADEHERKSFWNDRKNLGAIAKHTNAFKLNEDIVIPLEALPQFADTVEKINLQKELANDCSLLDELKKYFEKVKSETDDEHLAQRVSDTLGRLAVTGERFERYMNGLDLPVVALIADIAGAKKDATLFQCIQDGTCRISLEKDMLLKLHDAFHGFEEITEELDAIVASERKRKIVIATHMHAGDGNIHVNIPVHSSDYLMMQEAAETAAVAMKEAIRLGGVVSGEHGIGLTKLQFMERDALRAYRAYKIAADPGELFNPGKLDERFPLSSVYTPSFNLLELEAFILETTDLEKLSAQIASCVRCGKCKGVCCTNYPQGGLMYNPRNKILAVGLIIEAVLYHSQTMDMHSFGHFTKLNDIADHCTVCHKCRVPCPVKIDYGEVTVAMRELLVRRKKGTVKPITAMALFYLSRKRFVLNTVLRILVLKLGFAVQRAASSIHGSIRMITSALTPKINGLLEYGFPARGERTIRERLNLRTQGCFYCFENKKLPVRKSVLYFPGCGSERMLPEISKATVALLYRAGIRVVIPPEYSCCGYPFLANGKAEQAELRSYENRIMLHRIAESVGYMEISTVVVSCGTCLEMLGKYEVENIFPGCHLVDVNEYIVKEALYGGNGRLPETYYYHEPCHTPLKTLGYEKTLRSLLDARAILVPDCCGEAGTLSLSRPDISSSIRARKKNTLATRTNSAKPVILTTCPSCVLGIGKLNAVHKMKTKALVVQAAETHLGANWEKEFLRNVKSGGIQRILF